MRQPNKLSVKTFLLLIFLVINLIAQDVLGNLYVFHGNKHARSRKQVSSDPDQFLAQLNNLAGKPGEGYYLQVEIGTPKQKLNVLVDTGSSNFAVACKANKDLTRYFLRNESTTFKEMGKEVNVPYTQGSWNGILGQDFITITSLPNSTVFGTIACIDSADDFFINNSHWQGIMGLAFAGIARPDPSVEPIYDTLTKEGKVGNVFSVGLCGMEGSPNNSKAAPMAGSVIFGGIDSSLYTGDLYPTPIEKQWYYDVILVDIEVNNQSLGMDCKEYNFGKTIVDTGTTNLRLPSRVFGTLVNMMKASLEHIHDVNMPSDNFWTGEEVICWDEGFVPYDRFPIISLALPTNATSILKLDISPLNYLRPVSEENELPDKECFKWGISQIESGTVIGAVILEGFYVVFDREDNQVQFATSTCSHTSSLATKSAVRGNIAYTGDYKDCAYVKPDNPNSALTVVGYILAAVCGVCVVPLITLMIYMQLKHCRKCKSRSPSSTIDYSDLTKSS